MRDWRNSLQGSGARNAVMLGIVANLVGAYAVHSRLSQTVVIADFAAERVPVAIAALPDPALAAATRPTALALVPPAAPVSGEPELDLAVFPELPAIAEAPAQRALAAELPSAPVPAPQRVKPEQFELAFAPLAAPAPVKAERPARRDLPAAVAPLLSAELPLAAADKALPAELIPSLSTDVLQGPALEPATSDFPVRAAVDPLPKPRFGLVEHHPAAVS